MRKPNLKMRAIIRKSGEMITLHVQNLQTRETYLTGSYDLEFLTLPRTIIQDLKINQSMEKEVEIPLPGYVTINLKEAGEGCVFKEENGILTRIVNLDKNKTKQLYSLQPGKYRVTYRARSQKMTIFTIDRGFEVESEKEIQLDLI